jgi:L-seryl-tRNA(Ser) seleniumtransferase
MRIPSRLQELIPPAAVKQLMELVGQPSLLGGLRDASQKLGWKDSWQATNLRDAMQQAKRWVESVGARFGRDGVESRSSINATGQIFGDQWASTPLSSHAIQAYLAVTSGYCSAGSSSPEALKLLAKSVGAERVTLIHSIPLALRLVAQLGCCQGGFIVPRADCLRIGKTDFRSLLASNANIVEIGASNGCDESDFLPALNRSQLSTVTLFPSSIDHDDRISAHHDAAIHAAKSRGAISTEVILNAGLHDLKPYGLSVPTIAERIQAGADLVIVSGDGLMGGPACGIVIGKNSLVEEIERSAHSTGCQPNVGVLAAMCATISDVVDFESWKKLPIGLMITNSATNLEDRARRLCIQIQASEMVSSVSSETLNSPVGDGAWSKCSLASTALRIVPRNDSPEALATKLSSLPVPIVVMQKHDAIYVALRTVDPSEDRDIAAYFLDTPSTPDQGEPIPTAL